MGAFTTTRKAFRQLTDRTKARFDRREPINFLHIGKNAGSAFRHVARQVNRTSRAIRICVHGHEVRLAHLSPSERYVFAIRSPDTRFLSGFYSRKRNGRPLYQGVWSDHESVAFSHFEHANCLAEALFEDTSRGYHAFCAMKSISHCSMEQVSWFERSGYFLDLRPPVTIIRQERFEADLHDFLRMVGHTDPIELAPDDMLAHRFDYSDTPPLSDKAMANLQRWYAVDFEFYSRCVQWIEARTGSGGRL